MKLPTSDKTSTFGKKAYIKKGYYPGKLLKVVEFTNKDGNPKVGKFGLQLIFEFAIYFGDQKTSAPIEPMMHQPEEGKDPEPVIISKFAYHKYKKKDKDGKWIEGEYQTAITPKSAITKLLTALGWTFSTDDVDPEEFIGNFAELNLDDYTQGEGDEAYEASTIKDVSPYKGPEISKDLKDVKATESPKKVNKQVKHEAVESETEGDSVEIKKLEDQKANVEHLHKDGFLTDDGLKQAVEQIDTQIEGLKKK